MLLQDVSLAFFWAHLSRAAVEARKTTVTIQKTAFSDAMQFSSISFNVTASIFPNIQQLIQPTAYWIVYRRRWNAEKFAKPVPTKESHFEGGLHEVYGVLLQLRKSDPVVLTECMWFILTHECACDKSAPDPRTLAVFSSSPALTPAALWRRLLNTVLALG